MDTRALDHLLTQTLADGRLVRQEALALRALLEVEPDRATASAQLRARAFDLARQHAAQRGPEALLGWCEELVRLSVVVAASPATALKAAQARFSPGPGCLGLILDAIQGARQRLDVCVFTITDDRISDALLDAHRRKLALRILTDNDKAWDEGSDVQRLSRAGIAVRIDTSPYHMHHKFALVDGRTLLTGSYNWTRSAEQHNEENVVSTEDAGLVRAFSEEFEQLWGRFA